MIRISQVITEKYSLLIEEKLVSKMVQNINPDNSHTFCLVQHRKSGKNTLLTAILRSLRNMELVY